MGTRGSCGPNAGPEPDVPASDGQVGALGRDRAPLGVHAPAFDDLVVHALEHLVRVHRVVVEQEQAFDLGALGERRDLRGRGVSEPEPALVLVGQVLAVVDEDVGPVRDREAGDPLRRVRFEVGAEGRLVIRSVLLLKSGTSLRPMDAPKGALSTEGGRPAAPDHCATFRGGSEPPRRRWGG